MSDQAQNLRELVWRSRQAARVIAVTSGKGGVGKTSTSINLSIALAQRGQRVILLDMDLGLANVEVLMGLNSMFNIEHVISGQKKLSEILVTGPGGVQLVPGSSGMAAIADLTGQQRANLLQGIEDLQREADFVILDTMAGIGRNAVAFAAAADEVLLVATPEPTSIVDAYAMLKSLYHLRRDVFVRLLVNMASNQQQAKAVGSKLAAVSAQYLNRSLPMIGFLPRDPHVQQAVMQSKPFVIAYPNAPVSLHMHGVVNRLLQHNVEVEQHASGFLRRVAQTFGLASSA